MADIKKISPKEFEEWLDGAMIGDPKEARAYCERTMSPNYMRFQAGGGRTDFEKAVEKVTFFRGACTKWVGAVELLVQDGRQIAVRLSCEIAIGPETPKKVELMFMAIMDEQGRFEKVWELSMPMEEVAE